MIWIVVPLLALVLFGLHVRREAERIRADDARPRVEVRLKLAGSGMATRDELRTRQAVEDEIERRNIGRVIDAGSGDGYATLVVAADDAANAAAAIRALLAERGVNDAVVNP